MGNRRLRRGWGRPVLPSLLNVLEIDGLLGLYLDPHPVAGREVDLRDPQEKGQRQGESNLKVQAVLLVERASPVSGTSMATKGCWSRSHASHGVPRAILILLPSARTETVHLRWPMFDERAVFVDEPNWT